MLFVALTKSIQKSRIFLARVISLLVADALRCSEIARLEELTMPSPEKLDTHHKALTLNLDASDFGSFAEIGAGQEVARWFFVVGAPPLRWPKLFPPTTRK